MNNTVSVTQETKRFNRDSFRTNSCLKSEYVLKVNDAKNQEKPPRSQHKKGKNPGNLPAVRDNLAIRKARKLIVLTLLFLSCFSVSVYIGYTVTFMLFTMK